MKVLILAVLLVSACTSTPKNPCGFANDCSQMEQLKKQAGLPVARTVQLMLQAPTLIGGKPADPALWPASLYVKAGDASCSATLVGERTVFIAAHCMDNGGKITFNAHANRYSATCSHHPEYRGNDTADWALCLTDRPVIGVPFENLGIKRSVTLGQQLTLSGYGCIRSGGGGGNDGIFRVGQAKVTGLVSGKNYDIVTEGGAALCFGDSGGAAYVVDENGDRAVIAVNSRGDIHTMSYLPAVFSPSFVSWAKTWSTNSYATRICGLHADAVGCRGVSEQPIPGDGKFEAYSHAACVKGIIKPEYLHRKQSIVDGIQKAIDEM